MADDIISSFRRTFNAPIETYRQVQNVAGRDAIPSGVRWEGMIVKVKGGLTYELGSGLTNADWQEYGGISDAPNDGNKYVRQNGVWVQESAGGSSSVSLIDASATDIITNAPATDIVTKGFEIPAGMLTQEGEAIKIRLYADATSTQGFNRLQIGFNGDTSQAPVVWQLTTTGFRFMVVDALVQRRTSTTARITAVRHLDGVNSDCGFAGQVPVNDFNTQSNQLQLISNIQGSPDSTKIISLSYELLKF